MTVTIQSTARMFWLTKDGARIPCRIWEGTSANGTPVSLLVTRIVPTPPTVLDAQQIVEFTKDLTKHIEPAEYWQAESDDIEVLW